MRERTDIEQDEVGLEVEHILANILEGRIISSGPTQNMQSCSMHDVSATLGSLGQ